MLLIPETALNTRKKEKSHQILSSINWYKVGQVENLKRKRHAEICYFLFTLKIFFIITKKGEKKKSRQILPKQGCNIPVSALNSKSRTHLPPSYYIIIIYQPNIKYSKVKKKKCKSKKTFKTDERESRCFSDHTKFVFPSNSKPI